VIQIDLQRETDEKARQLETKRGANARTRHETRLRNAKRSRTKIPKPTPGAKGRPKSPQSKAGQGHQQRSHGQPSERERMERAREREVAEGRLINCVDTSPGSDTAPTCLGKIMAQCSMLGEAGAGASLTGRLSRWWAETVNAESERARGSEVGKVSNQMDGSPQAQEWRRRLQGDLWRRP
jgi:hypothetical protein